MKIADLPAVRRQALFEIAQALWHAAWVANKGTGKCPPVATLSQRHLRQWLGAAFAAEALIAKAKNDAVQQSVIINSCIKVLEKYRDENSEVEME